jgi:hypothetical protein
MATIKASFLLPVKDNDGRSLLADIKQTEEELWDRYAAFTHEGRVRGAYLMADGRKAMDIHKKYTLLLDDSRLSEMVELLREFKAKTTQETIYLEVVRAVELLLV